MIFLTITLKKNMEIKQNYHSQTQTRQYRKLKQKMFIKSFGMIKINSTIVIIPHHSPYFDKTNEKVIGRFKDEASAWKL